MIPAILYQFGLLPAKPHWNGTYGSTTMTFKGPVVCSDGAMKWPGHILKDGSAVCYFAEEPR